MTQTTRERLTHSQPKRVAIVATGSLARYLEIVFPSGRTASVNGIKLLRPPIYTPGQRFDTIIILPMQHDEKSLSHKATLDWIAQSVYTSLAPNGEWIDYNTPTIHEQLRARPIEP